MSVPGEPGSPGFPKRPPMRELLLAQALEACIAAERRRPGSASTIIAHQPAWARGDLRAMIGLVGSLDAAAADARVSPSFRAAARARLLQHIGGPAAPGPMIGSRLTVLPVRTGHAPKTRRRSAWMWRGSAGLVAALLGVTATLTASASALPGEPLYGLKQAQEEFSMRLAGDDQARALAMLGQADARLDETARLLREGRTEAAIETAQRYDQVVSRATTAYVVTIDNTLQQTPGSDSLESRLTQQQDQLQTILGVAPETARADLRQALVSTERGRALVADPRPVEQALGRAGRKRAREDAVEVPTTTAEDLPTVVPTPMPEVTVAAPAPIVVVVPPTSQPTAETLLARPETTGRSADSGARGPNRSARPLLPPPPQVARDDVETASGPALAAQPETSNGPGVPTQSRARPNTTTAPTANLSDSDAPQPDEDDVAPPVVAHQPAPVVSVPAPRSDAPGDKPGGGGPTNGASPGSKPDSSGPAGRTLPAPMPQLAVPPDNPNGGGDAPQDGDSRPFAPATPAARVQATAVPSLPIAVPSRRNGDGNENTRPTPAPAPARSPSVDTHGSEDRNHTGN